MTLNAKPLINWDNLFNRSTPTATDTETDFDVLNLIDWRRYTLWKAASVGTKYITVDLNQIGNPGLETGDGTDWTLNDATVDAGNPNSGVESLKLVAAGSNVDGGETDAVTVDTSKVYRLKTANDVDAYTGGDYHVKLHFYDSGDNLISTSILNTWQAATVGYEAVSKQIGPGGDVEFPAGTVSVSVQDAWDDTPTGTAYMDDVLFYEEKDPDALGLVNHNFRSANATVSLESSVAATEVIGATWVERVAGFTPDNDKAIWKSFTAVGTPQRAWRLKIVTANLAAYLGMTFLGEALELPRYMFGEWDPQPYTIRGTTGKSEGGNWLGVVRAPLISENTLSLVNLTDSFVRDTLGPVYDNHMRDLKPWLFTWDKTNHAEDVYLLSLRDGSRKSFPYSKSTRAITLNVTQVVEE